MHTTKDSRLLSAPVLRVPQSNRATLVTLAALLAAIVPQYGVAQGAAAPLPERGQCVAIPVTPMRTLLTGGDTVYIEQMSTVRRPSGVEIFGGPAWRSHYTRHGGEDSLQLLPIAGGRIASTDSAFQLFNVPDTTYGTPQAAAIDDTRTVVFWGWPGNAADGAREVRGAVLTNGTWSSAVSITLGTRLYVEEGGTARDPSTGAVSIAIGGRDPVTQSGILFATFQDNAWSHEWISLGVGTLAPLNVAMAYADDGTATILFLGAPRTTRDLPWGVYAITRPKGSREWSEPSIVQQLGRTSIAGMKLQILRNGALRAYWMQLDQGTLVAHRLVRALQRQHSTWTFDTLELAPTRPIRSLDVALLPQDVSILTLTSDDGELTAVLDQREALNRLVIQPPLPSSAKTERFFISARNDHMLDLFISARTPIVTPGYPTYWILMSQLTTLRLTCKT